MISEDEHIFHSIAYVIVTGFWLNGGFGVESSNSNQPKKDVQQLNAQIEHYEKELQQIGHLMSEYQFMDTSLQLLMSKKDMYLTELTKHLDHKERFQLAQRFMKEDHTFISKLLKFIQKMSQDNQMKRTRIDAMNRESKEKLQIMHETLQTKDRQLHYFKQQFEQLTKKNEQLLQHINQTEQTHQTLLNKLLEKEHALSNSQKKIVDLQKQKDSHHQSKRTKSVADTTNWLKVLSRNLITIEEKMQSVSTYVVNLVAHEQEGKEWTDLKWILENENLEDREDLKKFVLVLEQLNDEISTYKQLLQELEATITDLQHEENVRQEKVDQQIEKEQNLQSTIQKLQQENQKNSEALQLLKQQMQTVQEENNRLKGQSKHHQQKDPFPKPNALFNENTPPNSTVINPFRKRR